MLGLGTGVSFGNLKKTETSGALFLTIIGQSNARAAGVSSTAPPAELVSPTNTFMWSLVSSTWVPYQAGVNSDPTGGGAAWGSEAQFIKSLRDSGDTRAVYVQKRAVNGTSLGVNWAPGSGQQWGFWTQERLAARTALNALAPTRTEVIIWNQGEADTSDTEAPLYSGRLDAFIAAIRALDADGASALFLLERLRPCSPASVAGPLTPLYTIRAAQEVSRAGVLLVDQDFDPTNFTEIHPGSSWVIGKGLRSYLAWSTGATITDATPDAFTFTDQTGATSSAIITSDEITPVGYARGVEVTITGGEYRVRNPDDTVWLDWTSAAGAMHPRQKIQLRQTASASASTTTTCTVTIGGVSDAWTVTTAEAPPSYDADTQAWLDAVAAAGGASLSGAQASALDAFIVTAKAASWWNQDRIYFRANSDIASRRCLRTRQVMGSGVPWVSGQGWTPTANSQNSPLQWNPSTDAGQNDIGLGAWYVTLTFDADMDTSEATGSVGLRFSSDGSMRVRLHSSNINLTSGNITPGFRHAERTGANAVTVYGSAGTSIVTSTAASITPTATTYLLGTTGTASDRTIAAVWCGNAIGVAANVQAFRDALNTLLLAF